jgi:hypothetical protein
MSVTTFTGFVVIDGEQVLTYEQLRGIGFIGPIAEAEYLGGCHGINGLLQVRATPKQTELMDDHGLSLALVQTPWFHDRRLAMEPELRLDVIISEDHGEVLDLEYLNGYTRVAYNYCDGGESINVSGKLSVGAYSSNSPQPPVNLMADIGWNSVIPAMPSPADVLKQLGSQKSLADQFADAFASARPVPAPAWEMPKAPEPAPWASKPENQQAPEPVKPAPAYVKEVVTKPAPVGHAEMMNEMFGRFMS